MTAVEPVTVRAIQSGDREEWAALFRAYREFYHLVPDEAVIDRVWLWLMDDAHEVHAFVATSTHRLVGFAHYRRFARPSAGSVGMYLDDLFTDPDARGAGVGRALIGQVSAVAKREGCSVVRWITSEDNAAARRLYDSVATATPWITYDLVPGTVAQ
jgi:GNAT superfamily N-acetyltransferase